MFNTYRLTKAILILIVVISISVYCMFNISLDNSEASLNDIEIVSTSSNIVVNDLGGIDLNIEPFNSIDQKQSFSIMIKNITNQTIRINFEYTGPNQYVVFQGEQTITLEPQEIYNYTFTLNVVDLPMTELTTHMNVQMHVERVEK